MECRYKDIVVEQRQRATHLQFILLLAFRLALLIAIAISLGLMVGRIVAVVLFALRHTLEG